MSMYRATVKHAVNPTKEQVLSLDKPKPLDIEQPLSAGALEARALIEKARQLKEEQDMKVAKTLGEQLREKLDEAAKREMLNNTMKAWEQDENQQFGTGATMTTSTTKRIGVITNNASRETFNYVKQNPNKRYKEITRDLSARGFKPTTVSSLLYQMVTANLLSNNRGVFHAIADEFKPYNIATLRKNKTKNQKALAQLVRQEPITTERKKVVVIKRRKAEDVVQEQAPAGLGALTVNVDGRTIGTFKQHSPWKPEDVVDTLSLAQAKAVYVYLKNSFGG